MIVLKQISEGSGGKHQKGISVNPLEVTIRTIVQMHHSVQTRREMRRVDLSVLMSWLRMTQCWRCNHRYALYVVNVLIDGCIKILIPSLQRT